MGLDGRWRERMGPCAVCREDVRCWFLHAYAYTDTSHLVYI